MWTQTNSELENNWKVKTKTFSSPSVSISIQKKMGYKDLQSVKEFITKKSYVDNTLNLEEELFLDTLNKKVGTGLTSQFWLVLQSNRYNLLGSDEKRHRKLDR